MANAPEKCYCLEIFKKQYGDHVKGDCLKWSCARYTAEKKKEQEESDSQS